jgi:uncharacterized membrane protein SpoIIM required for sporulation
VDLDAFVAEHAGQWRRLEQLSGRRRLGPAEVDEMMALYQRTATHLSVVRSRSPDPALMARLSRIVLAARGAIIGSPGFSWGTIGRFFTESFPLAVYRAWRWWVAVGVISTGLMLALMEYVATHPDVQAAFPVDTANFAGRFTAFQVQNMALFIWTHNALASGLCLASGILIVPVFYFLLNNVLNVGTTGGAMISDGYGAQFFGLIAPHGLLELTAFYISAAAGLRIGWAWIAPGPLRTRGRAVAEAVLSAMLVALGLVGVLAVCGFIEAFVTPSPLPTPVRVGIGVTAWVGFLCYVFVVGRRAAVRADSVEVAADEDLLPAVVPTT